VEFISAKVRDLYETRFAEKAGDIFNKASAIDWKAHEVEAILWTKDVETIRYLDMS